MASPAPSNKALFLPLAYFHYNPRASSGHVGGREGSRRSRSSNRIYSTQQAHLSEVVHLRKVKKDHLVSRLTSVRAWVCFL